MGEARGTERRDLVIATLLAGTALFLGLAAFGWGNVSGLLAYRARAGFWALSLLASLVGLLSPLNFSSGEREDLRARWILVSLAVLEAGRIVQEGTLESLRAEPATPFVRAIFHEKECS